MTPTLGGHLAIVFDFGGVIFDWDPRYLYLKLLDGDLQAVDRFLEEIQFSEWNLRQDQGRPFSVAVTDHCAKFPQYCELIRFYDTYYEESISGPISGTVAILESLSQAGYPLYALSNRSTEKFALIRPKYAFLDWFKAILISGDVGIAKPDPRKSDALGKEITQELYAPFRWDETRRAHLRAILDAYYARLYGLNRKQLRFILDPADLTRRELEDILDPWEEVSDPLDPAGYAERCAKSDFPGETFRVLKEKELRQYGEYRTRRLVLEAWERFNNRR